MPADADTDARSPRLRDYDAKRDFARTPEPAGAAAAPAADGLRFVVQRHRPADCTTTCGWSSTARW